MEEFKDEYKDMAVCVGSDEIVLSNVSFQLSRCDKVVDVYENWCDL